MDFFFFVEGGRGKEGRAFGGGRAIWDMHAHPLAHFFSFFKKMVFFNFYLFWILETKLAHGGLWWFVLGLAGTPLMLIESNPIKISGIYSRGSVDWGIAKILFPLLETSQTFAREPQRSSLSVLFSCTFYLVCRIHAPDLENKCFLSGSWLLECVYSGVSPAKVQRGQLLRGASQPVSF